MPLAAAGRMPLEPFGENEKSEFGQDTYLGSWNMRSMAEIRADWNWKGVGRAVSDLDVESVHVLDKVPKEKICSESAVGEILKWYERDSSNRRA